MNIISSVHMEDQFVEEMRKDFPKYHYSEKLENFNSEQLESAEALVTYGNDLSAEMINKMGKLEWIHIMQSGTNNLPFDKLRERNILVTNSRGINSVAIAEYAIGMILILLRNSYVFYEAQKSKEWDLTTNIDELSGKTIGILGFGSIGREIAKRAKAFDMKVLAMRKTSTTEVENVDEMISFNNRMRIFSESDFIISLLPLTPETNGFIGEKELEKMKKSAYIMNLSRGNIINESALLESLKNDLIAGAVLDVFEQEPLPVLSELWDLKNVYITPHIAGDRHPYYMSRAFNILLKNTRNYQESTEEMINIVNLNQGY